jgi:predicted dehydrogenase
LLNKVGEQFGIKGRYTNYVEMIEKKKPDVVYAVMPPHHLYDVAATVMQMGCHLFIAPPDCDDRADAATGDYCEKK